MSKNVVSSDPNWRSDPPREPGRRRSLLEELARAGQSAGRLARGHLDLARAEAQGEVKKSVVDAGVGMGALPLSMAGLLMLDVALALGIGSWVGAAWGFLIVGVLNLIVAGTMGAFAAARLKRHDRMSGMRSELELDRAMARNLGTRLRRQKSAQVAPEPLPSAAPHPPAGGRLRGNGPAQPNGHADPGTFQEIPPGPR